MAVCTISHGFIRKTTVKNAQCTEVKNVRTSRSRHLFCTKAIDKDRREIKFELSLHIGKTQNDPSTLCIFDLSTLPCGAPCKANMTLRLHDDALKSAIGTRSA